MSKAEKVNVTLIPSGGNEAEVDAQDFQKQLAALLSALKESAKATNFDTADQVKYKVEKLTTNSPACVGLRGEAVESSDGLDIAAIHAKFNEAMRFVEGAIGSPKGISAEWVKRMNAFCKPIGKSLTEVKLNVGDKSYQLGIAFRKKLQKIEAKDFVEKGSHIKGEIRMINIQAKKPSFVIFPRVGPEKIRCAFPPALVERARKSVGETITVYGDFKYHWKERFPYEMKVSRIQEMPEDISLPTADQIWGLAPDATGGSSSEEFISALRDGDQ